MGDCVFDLASAAHLERIRDRAMAENIPLHGTLDLTHRCNLRGSHCYLGSHEHEVERLQKEMSTAQVLGLLDEMAEAGCLYLLISGGEPLLRPDFCEIYRHARALGMWVSVFTNGTLLSEEHMEAFREYPPYLVEITLYGATERTYETVTGVPGSFARCRKAIDRLVGGGVRLILKTIILKANAAEVPDMEGLARSLGVRFRIDGTIMARVDGDKGPLSQRLSAEEVVEIEFANPERFEQFEEFYLKAQTFNFSTALYQCAAGRMAFHIHPTGALRPCFAAVDLSFDALSGGFRTAWRMAVEAVKRLTIDPASPCYACDKKVLCGYCPALIALESTDGVLPPAFLCELGTRRLNTLEKNAPVRRNQ